jgi:hypothetical protein
MLWFVTLVGAASIGSLFIPASLVAAVSIVVAGRRPSVSVTLVTAGTALDPTSVASTLFGFFIAS